MAKKTVEAITKVPGVGGFSGAITSEYIKQLEGEREAKASQEEREFKRETETLKRSTILSKNIADQMSGFFKKHGDATAKTEFKEGESVPTDLTEKLIGTLGFLGGREIGADARLKATKIAADSRGATQKQKSAAWAIMELGKTLRKDADAFRFGMMNEKQQNQYKSNSEAYHKGLSVPIVGDIVKDAEKELGFEPIAILGIKTGAFKPTEKSIGTYKGKKYVVGDTFDAKDPTTGEVVTWKVVSIDPRTKEPVAEPVR